MLGEREETEISEEEGIIEKKKENFFSKIINKIKSVIKKK